MCRHYAKPRNSGSVPRLAGLRQFTLGMIRGLRLVSLIHAPLMAPAAVAKFQLRASPAAPPGGTQAGVTELATASTILGVMDSPANFFCAYDETSEL